MIENKFTLFAAAHAPVTESYVLNLSIVEKQAAHFLKNGVGGVFVNGSTGEYSSLTIDQRKKLAEKWADVSTQLSESKLRVIVHVGDNCQANAVELAEHADKLNIEGISALAPSYFKPASTTELIEFLTPVADVCQKPFYFYDIPGLTGFDFATSELLERAEELKTLKGIKFTNPNLCELQKCIQFSDEFEILFGFDEWLMSGLIFGAHGAIGSTYNFAAPIYTQLIDAVNKEDWQLARSLQCESVRLIELLAKHNFMSAAKCTMSFIGIDCGPALSPNKRLNQSEIDQLRANLEEFGFFEKWTV